MWRVAACGGAAGPSSAGRAALGGAATGFRRGMAGFDRKAYKEKIASKQVKKVVEGRDPYELFKQAMVSQCDPASLPSPDPDERKAASAEIRAARSEYSRHKFREHHLHNAHFTRMIKLREAAIAALPEALQAEARAPDLEPIPVQRRVFTETAPIADFQEKLIQRVRE